MVTISLIGLLVFAMTRNGLLSTVPFALGTLVKYLSGLGLLWLGIASVARTRSWRLRCAHLLGMGVISAGLAVFAAAPWLELPDSLDPLLAETTNVGYVNALPDLLTRRSPHLVDSLRGCRLKGAHDGTQRTGGHAGALIAA